MSEFKVKYRDGQDENIAADSMEIGEDFLVFKDSAREVIAYRPRESVLSADKIKASA